ncbi:PAS domain-containing sensor histidine kinase [Desulforegula conservatrix]|uniref:PAS domain-containing sensor histidine kinase n=1 Tax=Desulforegula conservatrix TaxID=153026 RepID=UPI0018DC8571|nr:PAS domain-containing sensor histidine kinase [Desulforegula conservatrix]
MKKKLKQNQPQSVKSIILEKRHIMLEIITEFASPEKSTIEEIIRQSAFFNGHFFMDELMHHIPDMVMILNKNRQIVYINKSTLEASGLKDPDKAMGMRMGELLSCKHSNINPGGCGTSSFCRYCGAVNSILESQKERFKVDECRITTKTAEGEEALDLRAWATPIKVNGEPFTFLVLVNIAEEKKKLFLERIFLHDIMNTAVALRGFSQLIESESKEDVELKNEFLGRISFLSERIVDEINAHRQLLAAENNELQLDIKKINAKLFLEKLFNTYNRPDILETRHLITDWTSDDAEFESDPTLLGRVVGNMIKNAIEASVPGETITMGCRKDDESIFFWIHNNTYMPENIRLQVFKRSFSTKGTGRGLGTYSMKYLTDKYLKGSISFSTSEPEGTVFEAQYPLAFCKAQ